MRSSHYHTAFWEDILMETLVLKYLNKLIQSILFVRHHLASKTHGKAVTLRQDQAKANHSRSM